jgi:hypothetical protein
MTDLPEAKVFDTVKSIWKIAPMQNSKKAVLRTDPISFKNGNKDKIFIFGNAGQYGEEVSGGGVYDAATLVHTPLPTVNAPSLREVAIAALAGDKIIVWGGVEVPTGIHLQTGSLYDFAKNTWTPMSLKNAPEFRQHAEFASSGSYLFVFGGLGAGDFQKSGAIYNVAIDQWTPISFPVDVKEIWRPKITAFNGEFLMTDVKCNSFNEKVDSSLFKGYWLNPKTGTWRLAFSQNIAGGKVRGCAISALGVKDVVYIVGGYYTGTLDSKDPYANRHNFSAILKP